MTAYDSIQELRDLYASLEARVAKLETLVKQLQAPSRPPPTQEEIAHAEYGSPSWQPTEKQLKYAKDISAALGHNIDLTQMTRQDVSDYITRYRQQYFQRLAEKQRLERDASRMKPLVEGARA